MEALCYHYVSLEHWYHNHHSVIKENCEINMSLCWINYLNFTRYKESICNLYS